MADRRDGAARRRPGAAAPARSTRASSRRSCSSCANALAGPGVTASQALAAVDRVYAGAEVIDSRYRDFRFTLPDVVADNASSGAFVVGSVGLEPEQLDLRDGGRPGRGGRSGRRLRDRRGRPGQPGRGARTGRQRPGRCAGSRSRPGWIVLTGGMTDAFFAPPGATHRVPLHQPRLDPYQRRRVNAAGPGHAPGGPHARAVASPDQRAHRRCRRQRRRQRSKRSE